MPTLQTTNQNRQCNWRTYHCIKCWDQGYFLTEGQTWQIQTQIELCTCKQLHPLTKPTNPQTTTD